MAITVATNFKYEGQSPNFERDQFKTRADMLAYSPNYLDEGHISYCLEDKKHYKWNGSSWEEFKTGGGESVSVVFYGELDVDTEILYVDTWDTSTTGVGLVDLIQNGVHIGSASGYNFGGVLIVISNTTSYTFMKDSESNELPVYDKLTSPENSSMCIHGFLGYNAESETWEYSEIDLSAASGISLLITNVETFEIQPFVSYYNSSENSVLIIGTDYTYDVNVLEGTVKITPTVSERYLTSEVVDSTEIVTDYVIMREDIVQELGDNEDKIMSQKAVTDAIQQAISITLKTPV